MNGIANVNGLPGTTPGASMYDSLLLNHYMNETFFRRLDAPMIVTNQTIPPRSYSGIYGSFFTGAAVATVASFAWCLWYVYRRKAPLISLVPLWIVYVSLGDFISDFTFISQMPREPEIVDTLRLSSIIFIMGASVVNMSVMAAYLMYIVTRGGPAYAPFVRWLGAHKTVTGVLLVSSLTSARMLTLIHSGLFEISIFSAPLPMAAIEVLDLLGLITVLLEDVPQLVINCYISEVTQTWDSVSFTAVGFSVLSIAVSIACRFAVYAFLFDEERADTNNAVMPEHVKGTRAFRKGSIHHVRHMFEGGGQLDGAHQGPSQKRWSVRVTKMPEVINALRQIAGDKDKRRQGGLDGRADPADAVDATHDPMSVHNVYSVVSMPLVVVPGRHTEKARRDGTLPPGGLHDALAAAYEVAGSTPPMDMTPIAERCDDEEEGGVEGGVLSPTANLEAGEGALPVTYTSTRPQVQAHRDEASLVAQIRSMQRAVDEAHAASQGLVFVDVVADKSAAYDQYGHHHEYDKEHAAAHDPDHHNNPFGPPRRFKIANLLPTIAMRGGGAGDRPRSGRVGSSGGSASHRAQADGDGGDTGGTSMHLADDSDDEGTAMAGHGAAVPVPQPPAVTLRQLAHLPGVTGPRGNNSGGNSNDRVAFGATAASTSNVALNPFRQAMGNHHLQQQQQQAQVPARPPLPPFSSTGSVVSSSALQQLHQARDALATAAAGGATVNSLRETGSAREWSAAPTTPVLASSLLQQVAQPLHGLQQRSLPPSPGAGSMDSGHDGNATDALSIVGPDHHSGGYASGAATAVHGSVMSATSEHIITGHPTGVVAGIASLLDARGAASGLRSGGSNLTGTPTMPSSALADAGDRSNAARASRVFRATHASAPSSRPGVSAVVVANPVATIATSQQQ